MKRLPALIKLGKKKFIINLGIGPLVILMLANLNALIDRVTHPEIPYFDDEHLIVGGVTVIVTSLLYILLMIYVTNLQKKEYEIRKLSEELERKVEERTRELINAQEELVQSEKLAMFGLIAANMGNELRNPLGVMNNAVYFLGAVLTDADATVREHLEIIRSEIGNSQRIIEELLDFFRDKPLRTEVIPVHELIHQIFDKSLFPENIRLLTDLSATLPAVKVDPLQMGQVFRNLIVNAVQAMPEGGNVRVSARKVRGTTRQERGTRNEERGNKDLSLEPRTSILDHRSSILEPDFIEITFADTGEGIVPENMTKLFQPLFTTKSRGIGLGLAISKKLIEANGGRIEVESRLGEGTTFTLILPTVE